LFNTVIEFIYKAFENNEFLNICEEALAPGLSLFVMTNIYDNI